MSIYRYLLHIAYIGKPFRGAQRQVKASIPRLDDPLTVQGRLEMALKQLKPINEPVVALSSRTDSGVHAINTTCHVDLHRRNGMEYDPRTLTICLNRYFNQETLPIRIISTHLVPETFHCRHNAVSRTYLYRLAIAKAKTPDVAPKYCNYVPIEEWGRCFFYRADTFDMNRMREAAKQLEGFHDFRTFMATYLNSNEKDTKRVIDYIKIKKPDRRGYSNIYSWPDFISGNEDYEYLFIDVYIKSKGFLYKQAWTPRYHAAPFRLRASVTRVVCLNRPDRTQPNGFESKNDTGRYVAWTGRESILGSKWIDNRGFGPTRSGVDSFFWTESDRIDTSLPGGSHVAGGGTFLVNTTVN
ncbi:hypothetical protein NQ315_017264 [Exocentrus adspersus]|uniref:tRNA pseudouridine synthase n=1 Tax=Exocentrus adspersus TaxID=1586481 RepID=A0AAV8VFI8_9CUCU|nr:hypothetical protein NQ315_017264 [Exocentrus adspersus]